MQLNQSTVFTQCMHGIGGQIEDGLFHLGGVCQHAREVRCSVDLQLNRWRQGHTQQPLCVSHDFAGIYRVALGRFIAAEGQNLTHQITGTAAGLFNFQQTFQCLRVVAAIGLGQLDVTENGTNDVVEVVGNAASHGAQRLHLVGFAQLQL